jgi:hypothetical protein
MKTLNEQYQLIKEGKGHKGVFLKEAKSMFPNYIRNAATFDEVSLILKQKGVINENIVGLSPINTIETKKESFETAFEKFLAEAAKSQEESDKAEAKTPSKQVEEKEEKTSKPTDKKEDKNFDNMIFDQIMTGYYAEMKDPKNVDKTMQELKDIVLKNLSKDPIYYAKDGQFGVKGLGYTTEHPGLGTPKEAKGKYKSSGYGDLKENIQTQLKGGLWSDQPLDTQVKHFIKKNNLTLDKNPISWEERMEGSYFHDFLDKNTSDVSSWHIHNGMANPENQQSWDLVFGDEMLDELEKFKSGVKQAFSPSNKPKPSPEQIKADREEKRRKELERRENEIREAIRSIVDQELEEVRGGGNYGILSINTSNVGGTGGKRFIPTVINMPLSLRKKFGEHMIYNPGSETFYVSQILYNNLIKGYTDQPAIKKLIMDIPPMLKQLLNKTENYGQPTELPKQFKMYLPFREPVEKAKEDKFNKAGTKQYWSAGDFLFPNLNKEKYAPEELAENYEELDHYMSVIQSNNMSEDEAYDFLEDQGLESSKIDSIINQIFQNNLQEQLLRKVIRESVEKELSAINKEAESEVISAKLEKIDAAIEKRQSQLNKLDEDEDMKALTDKTKIKQAQKDIKTLEKAKAKLEKDLSKIKKKNKDVVSSDIIDEDTPIDEAMDDQKVDKVKTSLEDINKTVDDISTKTKEMFESEGELPQDIINQAVEMFANVNGDSDEIINIASNFPEYEESVVEFLEGYDLGLDYDI